LVCISGPPGYVYNQSVASAVVNVKYDKILEKQLTTENADDTKENHGVLA